MPFRRCGKLIVAAEAAELDILDTLKARAEENGVDDLVLLDASQTAAREPEIAAAGALLSPSTGIVDSHGLMMALSADAEAAGAILAFHAPASSGEIRPDGIVLEVGGREPVTLYAQEVVNSAGLGAQEFARTLQGFCGAHIPDRFLAKGSYCALSGRSPFSCLVYPTPAPGGLGIHATLDLDGRCRFGPDVEWVEEIDYDVAPERIDAFYEAVRRYWPGLPDGALQPDYSGIRPKLQRPGEPAADFMVEGPEDHGAPGLVNLFGIESPGLTASLALAELVRDKLDHAC